MSPVAGRPQPDGDGSVVQRPAQASRRPPWTGAAGFDSARHRPSRCCSRCCSHKAGRDTEADASLWPRLGLWLLRAAGEPSRHACGLAERQT